MQSPSVQSATPDAMLIMLAAAIRRRRTQLGYTQEGFADAIGMHRAYYGTIENGRRNLTLATLSRLAAGLQCPMSSLLLDAEQCQPNPSCPDSLPAL